MVFFFQFFLPSGFASLFSLLPVSSSSSLVVALQSLDHEQLPQILRGEFLHVLAVVVDLPCWRVAACTHAAPR